MQQEINTGLTIEQTTEQVMQSLERNVAQQLENYATGVEAINGMAILSQKMATQRMVISIAVKQRVALETQLKMAQGSPLMEEMITAQIDTMEEQIVGHLIDAGVSQQAAKKALKNAAETVKLELVTRENNGRIKALTKSSSNGTHTN